MGLFGSSDNYEQEQHNAGQEVGSQNGFVDSLFHDFVWSHVESDAFNQGYENGRNNPSSGDDEDDD